MRRCPIPINVIALAMLVTSLPAQQPQLSPTPPTVQLPTGEGTKARALFAPGPEYPEYARKHHWVGVAWYLMHVDTKTGLVTSVEITHSTGHKVLDQAGADALRRWKWKPGAVPGKIKIPITFALPLQKAAQ